MTRERRRQGPRPNGQTPATRRAIRTWRSSALCQIRLTERLTGHLHRLEVEANAKHAAQPGEADPPNQQFDDDHHDHCVQRGQDLRR